jgi:uncharacterized glyoxalase superfamily protein PhnB
MQFYPYLNFNGDCEAAFKLYERVLGGEIVALTTHGDSPSPRKFHQPGITGFSTPVSKWATRC